jgi:uncharacterized protein
MFRNSEIATSVEAASSSPPFLSFTAPTRGDIGARLPMDRVVVLDILRGLALLGMFMVHFNYYEATPLGAEPSRMAAFVERFLGLFIDERFYGIFGMLFGVGFAVQLERADSRGERFVARYFRRLVMLAVFGFIAEGVFGYNVLFGYAMWGLPLLLVRRWPVKALVVLAIICAAARPIYAVTRIAIASTRPDGVTQLTGEERAQSAAFQAAVDTLRAAERSGSWKTVVAARVRHMPKFHRQWSVLPNSSFLLFLFGVIAWKLGLFTQPEKHRRLIVSLALAGVAATVVATFLMPFGGPPPPRLPTDPPVQSAIGRFARVGFHLIRPQWLTFTYIGAILLLVASNRDWLRRLAPFAWAGRMALTNYMVQVVLLEVLFRPHGFGLTIPAPLVLPGAVALFVAQVFMSRWWLTRFRNGPLEWIWRSVTYWSLQPLRSAPRVVAPRLAA